MSPPPEPGPGTPAPERRRGERRQRERRRSARREADRLGQDRGFEGLGPVSGLDAWDAGLAGLQAGPQAPSAGGPAARGGVPDEALEAALPMAAVEDRSVARTRILRTYVAARGALGLALLLLPWAAVFLMGGRLPWPMLAVSLAYAGQAVSLWLLHDAQARNVPLQGLKRQQWLSTIGVDLVAFSLLRWMDPASQLNFAALLVLPVLMAGVLTPRVPALATAAAVSLMLLAGTWLESQHAGDALLHLSQAGLAGAGLFLIALLASELSARLAGEERSARQSLELARQQVQLNRVVIEEMAEGVLVVDRQGQLRTLNPAARRLLGPQGPSLVLPVAMAAVPRLERLGQIVAQAFERGRWPETGRELLLGDGPSEPAADAARAVQVRARFTRRLGIAGDGATPEDFCVLLLEDLRLVRARQRQDKLAAMGRVSAGIAHEIRNPLAAIAQANALLQEEALPPGQARLARIVQDNVARLSRIVDDVMAVAPDGQDAPARCEAVATVRIACEEWLHTAITDPQHRARLLLPAGAPEPQMVWFDPEHLRRVLVNLLDNAGRHAGGEPGAIQVSLEAMAQAPLLRLTVASDGPPIAPDIERHLFEPFFSSRSRGSGLGLYICRELCERHGASIEFRLAAPGVRHRNRFSVLMRLAQGGPAAQHPPGAPAVNAQPQP